MTLPSILVELDTAIDAAHGAKRRQFLLFPVARVAVGDDEVGRLAGAVRVQAS